MKRRRLEPGLLARARLDQLGLEPALARPSAGTCGAASPPSPARRCRPSPAWIVTTASPASYSPLKSASSWSRSSSSRSGVTTDSSSSAELAVHREQLLRVLVVALEALVALEPLGQARVLGRHGRRALLVVPESRCAELALELGEALPQPLGVKGNHGPSRAGPRSPRAAAPAAVRLRPCGQRSLSEIVDEREHIARLLVSCPDRHGIVAAVSGFLSESDANILSSDQHSTDPEGGTFFMRMEFRLEELRRTARGARARLRRADRGAVRDGLAASPTRASASASRCSPRARTTACSTCSGAGGAASSTPTSSRVVSNHADHAADVAGFGVPFHHVPVPPGGKAEAEARMLELLAGEVDLVVLARYMQILSRGFLERLGVPVINIHHSFLPAFVGADPYRRARERGVKIIGATAHYVTEELDAGPIIEQDVARVSHRESVERARADRPRHRARRPRPRRQLAPRGPRPRPREPNGRLLKLERRTRLHRRARLAVVALVVGYFFLPYGVRYWIPVWLPFAAARRAGGPVLPRRLPRPAPPAARGRRRTAARRHATSSDLGWPPEPEPDEAEEDDERPESEEAVEPEEYEALAPTEYVPAEPPPSAEPRSLPRRLAEALFTLAVVAGILYYAVRPHGWDAVSKANRARAESVFSREATKIAGHRATVVCDTSFEHVGIVQDADGAAQVGGGSRVAPAEPLRRALPGAVQAPRALVSAGRPGDRGARARGVAPARRRERGARELLRVPERRPPRRRSRPVRVAGPRR